MTDQASGMTCSHCGSPTRVTHTHKGCQGISYARRACTNHSCGAIFTEVRILAPAERGLGAKDLASRSRRDGSPQGLPRITQRWDS